MLISEPMIKKFIRQPAWQQATMFQGVPVVTVTVLSFL